MASTTQRKKRAVSSARKRKVRATPAADKKAGVKQQERSINGHSLKFTNLDKIYWPKEKITKRDMLNYYYHSQCRGPH